MQRIFVVIFLFGFAQAHAQKKITVGKDSTSDFNSVQAAVESVPVGNKTPVIINIKPGVYKERVRIDSGRNFIHLQGQKGARTLLTFALHAGSVLYSGDTLDTWNCGSTMIFANDFSAENIHFENNAGFYAGEAVAVRAHGNRISFKNCAFTGFQAVLFLSGTDVKQYFENCYIEGSTDFIFGAATVVFNNCRIHSKKNSHITAASTPADVPFGFVFINCNITADAHIDNVSLGRPWRPYSSVTYLNCQMAKHIRPAGWDNWRNEANEKTVRYAEFNNTGAGAKPADRVAWSHQLTADQAKKFTIQNVLRPWNPLK